MQRANRPVGKASAANPTKVILCGSFLGNTQAAGRDQLTRAMVKSLVNAVYTRPAKE